MSTDGPKAAAAESGGRRPAGDLLGILRGVALIAVVAGAAGSVGLMLRAGHPAIFLLVLFTGWVLSPFVVVVVANMASKRWSVLSRATLYGGMLILTLSSLVCYGGLVSMPPGTRPAAVFLLVPLASWLLLAIALAVSALTSRRRSRRGASA